MIEPEKYWTYAQPPIPELADLPSKTFAGNKYQWESLSPGMRRTIWKEAWKRSNKRPQQGDLF